MKKRALLLSMGIVFVFSYSNLLHAAKTRGVTDKTINIGCSVDLTGPSSFLGRGASAGAEAYFKYVNDQGGINGRKIKYIVEDNTYQPATAIAALKKLIYRDKIFALCFSWGSVTTLAIADAVKTDNVPTIFYGHSEAVCTPPKRHIFSPQTTSYRMSIGAADYIMKELKPKDTKFACIYQDDEFGKAGLRGFRDAAKFYGVEWVGEEHYKRGALDFTSQILSLKKAGADYVYLAAVLTGGAGILREAKKLDWQPHFFGDSSMTDMKLLELAGDSAEGYIGTSVQRNWGEDTPGVKKVKTIMMKYRGDLGGMSTDFISPGYAEAMVMTEGLKRAGKDLTADKLIRALESLKNFDPDGLIPSVTFGPDRREGGVGVRLVKPDFANKVFVQITGWRTPELKR